MSRSLSISLVACTVAAGAFAQTATVVPKNNGLNEQHSHVVLPYNDTNMILQQWMPATDVAVPNGRTIVGLSFIQEGNFGLTATTPRIHPAATFDLIEIRLAAGAAAFGTNPSTNFDSGSVPAGANYSQPNVTIPGYTSPQATAANNTFLHMFTTPHVYDATKPLLLDIRNLATNQTNVNNVARTADRSLPASIGAIRAWGCPAGAITPSFGTIAGGLQPGVTQTIQVTNTSTTVTAWAFWFGFNFSTPLASGFALNTILPGVGPLCQTWVEPTVMFTGTGTTFPQNIVFPIPASVPVGTALGIQTVFLNSAAAGGLNTGPGLYGLTNPIPWPPQNATRLGLRQGNGDFTQAASPQPLLDTIPLQLYAVTVKFLYN